MGFEVLIAIAGLIVAAILIAKALRRR